MSTAIPSSEVSTTVTITVPGHGRIVNIPHAPDALQVVLLKRAEAREKLAARLNEGYGLPGGIQKGEHNARWVQNERPDLRRRGCCSAHPPHT